VRVFRVRFGNEAGVRAHVAAHFARTLDVVLRKLTLVDEPMTAVCVDVGSGYHAASGSYTMVSRSPARVSVNMRLAVPRGRTTTTSKARARP
jgi:hypothetical protein